MKLKIKRGGNLELRDVKCGPLYMWIIELSTSRIFKRRQKY